MRGFGAMILGLCAYVGMLGLSQRLLAGDTAGEGMQILLSLAPMLPAIFLCVVIIRMIRRMDEMQRKLQVEALALAFAGTALLTFGYGFLEGVGLPRLSMFAVWPVMAGLWVVGVLVGRFRLG
ncbi:hypothetical protein [Pararhodobacter sp.]|uniref:hypothetical protein n=1 Tax=Pararhodobacter sp. TaxID=2127056 RepID=UPI002AFE30CE|nr:hypothetical protein [Pararhodobacter sp.]